MEEVATLVIRVKSEETELAKSRLKDLGYAAQTAETATGKLSSAWRSMAGLFSGLLGIGTVIAGLNKLKDTARDFDSLEAQLKTATGTSENAAIAFQALTDFATRTPYDLKQTVGAFIQLVNLGLNPSERAMSSYGNTASAMGRQLSEFVTAVSRATSGEFEPLKSFGIKARTEADGIAFTFRGVTTKVKNSTKEIEDYFIKLGESNFSGAMADRMGTLEGKLSNLGDAWDQLFASIGKAGASDLMKSLIDEAISALTELTAMISSGQLVGYIDAFVTKFSGIWEAFKTLKTAWEATRSDADSAVNWIVTKFSEIPESVTALAKIWGSAMGAIVEVAVATGRGIYDGLVAYFDLFKQNLASSIANAKLMLNPSTFVQGFTGMYKDLGTNIETFGDKASSIWAGYKNRISATGDALAENVDAILAEKDATLKATGDKIKAADDLRAAWEREEAARKAAAIGKDRQAGFGKGGAEVTAEFTKLRETLRTQSQVLAETYAKRKAVIMANEGAEQSVRDEMLARNEATYTEQRRALLDRSGLDLAVQKTILEDQQAQEVAMLEQKYETAGRLLDEAHAAGLIKEEEYNRRKEQLSKRHGMATTQLANENLATVRSKQLQMYSEVLSIGANIADQMAQLVEGNSAAAKTMFIAAKAIAIAQAIVYTELAATKAMAEGGFIAGIPMSVAIRALGYTSVGLMAATSVMEYGGKFEHGGMIPAGKYGIVGETGQPELVRGPAVVTSARRTAELGGGSSAGTVVNVHNYAGAEIRTQEREDASGAKILEIFVKKARDEFSNEITRGTGALSKALQSAYPLARGRSAV